jgi:hypothetical protein
LNNLGQLLPCPFPRGGGGGPPPPPHAHAHVWLGFTCKLPSPGPYLACDLAELHVPEIEEFKLTLATKTPMTAVASSGAEDPAAINVAPATSGGMFNTTEAQYHLNVLFSHTRIFTGSMTLYVTEYGDGPTIAAIVESPRVLP